MGEKVDKLALIGTTEDGPVVIRRDGETGEVDGPAKLVPVKEGQPIPEGADYVMARQTKNPRIWDSVTVFSNRKGPPKVVSPEYRENYDKIFGGDDDDLLN
jgi:hypothetical protein